MVYFLWLAFYHLASPSVIQLLIPIFIFFHACIKLNISSLFLGNHSGLSPMHAGMRWWCDTRGKLPSKHLTMMSLAPYWTSLIDKVSHILFFYTMACNNTSLKGWAVQKGVHVWKVPEVMWFLSQSHCFGEVMVLDWISPALALKSFHQTEKCPAEQRG